ncbi:dihydrolipoamide acetyltransferase family protein [Oceanobacillus sp. J11TS1]|uniref:dihydrolipoamide acetyltransferase family protein n=1 Tax=Oceanobacillus sp. J11TS1 TaxID=2807191 RepID=UPI001FD0B246|nr:dihydrolipoamide acetyltransferase family protein [Oceanobacillus sp. J11TS1]
MKLHDTGEGMSEGVIQSYFIKEGDFVDANQRIAVVQTEKMPVEITAPVQGVVREILIQKDRTFPVGTAILIIDEQLKAKGPQRIKAAPSVRKIARKENVDLTLVIGTGVSGRITREDVYYYSKNKRVDKTPALDAISNSLQTDVNKTKIDSDSQKEVLPLREKYKQITASRYTIPLVSHFEEIDVTNLLRFQQEMTSNVSASITAYLIKALGIALKDYPIFNAHLGEEGDRIKLIKKINIGLKNDSDNGTTVAVLKNVVEKSLKEIDAEMKELRKKALENTLQPNEMQGSTFTISNLEQVGSTSSNTMINYPETGFMTFHKMKKIPVVNEDDEIVIRSIMKISLSFDHRVTDGGNAVAFTNHLKSLIENPHQLLFCLA